MLPGNLNRDLARALRNHHYERVDAGTIFVPQLEMEVCGYYTHTINGLDKRIDKNLVVTEGRNKILDVGFNGDTQITDWFLGLATGSATPVATWTGANVVANFTEFLNYTQTTRVAWTSNGDAAAGVVANTSATARFTADTGGGTVTGAFLAEAAAKSATSGVLNSASKFTGSRVMLAGDNLDISYTLTLTSS